jgi:hypothetical protein
VRIDSETQRTVLQFRDGSDGKVIVQYPSEKQLEAYRSKANTERAKEQEKAEARISGEKDALGGTSRTGTSRTGTSQTGTGQQAGSPIAGSAAGESASAKAPTSSSPQAAAISVSVSAAPVGASVAQSMPSVAGGGGGRPVLQSISA